MLKRILVGVSGTPIGPAKVHHAVDIAGAHGAEISVLSVVDVDRLSKVGPVPVGAGYYAEQMRRHKIERSHALDEQTIGAFEGACAKAQVPLRVLRYEGDPLEHLTRAWRYHDLCILGTRGWFDYGVLPEPENAVMQVVRGGVRPILALTEEIRPIRRALVAYNGSSESAKSMKQFVQMRLWHLKEIHLACVNQPKSGEPLTELFDDVTEYLRMHGHRIHATALDGAAADALLNHAHAIDADVIVLGSSYRKLLVHERLGRNAVQLIKRSDRPLFLSH